MINIFSKKSVGLDIAEHTIEAVELIKKATKVNISSLGRVLLEPGIVERGRIKDEKKLAIGVKQVFLESKPHPIIAKKIIFGLPESQTYIHIFELKPHNKNDRNNLVLKEARASIPLKSGDLLFSYKALYVDKDRAEILLVATSKEMLQEWQQFFQKLGLEAEVFDIEPLATFRGLFTKIPEAPVCIVDMGAVTTNITIFDGRGLRYAHSINVAGDTFNKEIAKALNIGPKEAEKQKIKIGLTNKNTQIFPVLIKALESVSKEIKTLLNYFQKRTKQKVHPVKSSKAGAEQFSGVKEIILVGGSSKLKGIVDYFKTDLGLPVRVGKSILLEKKIPLEYIEAVGLALRGLDKKWSQKDPAISIETKNPHRKAFGFLRGRHKTIKTQKEKEELAPTIESDEESSLSLVSEREQKKKLRSKKILLIIILIIGVVIVGLAYWYRNYEKAQKEEKLQTQLAQYTETQSFDLKIPVAVDSAEYTPDRMKGRIIENVIEMAGHYDEAVAHSRIAVEKELKEGESLWLTPINPEQTVFPMTIKWLVYSEKDANELFLKEIDKLNKDKIDYALNNIEKTNLEATDNQNIFYLTGKVTISLNQLIGIEEESLEKEEITKEVTEEIAETTESVLIKETETGWLRVRKGPETTYDEIAKVYPGETYPLLEESGNWYKIELDNNLKGWIHAKYATKQ